MTVARYTDAYYGPGCTLTLAAPYDVTAGAGALVGSIFGVAKATLLSGVSGEFETAGEFKLTKAASQAWTVGQRIFWDVTNKRCTSDGSLGPEIGFCTIVAASGAAETSGYVRLNGIRAAMTTVPTSTLAAAGTTAANGGALPSSGFVLVTAADATKGVTLPSAVAGMRLEIKNSAAAVLKVWPATGDAVNAGAVDAVFSCPASTSFTIVAYDATTWYTIPLVPS
jgi:predicted RecA/RadA family phage recombinase